MEAFATVDDLALRLNRTFTDDEEAWIGSLLADASTYLRDDVLGLQVFPQQQATFSARATDGFVVLPQQPVISVDAVTDSDDAPIWFDWIDDRVYVRVHRHDRVNVTFTFGFAEPPESLVRWTCVLVSQVLIPLEQQLGLTVGGLSSVQIDDFRAAFADAGDSTGITLSDRNIALIREQYGVRGSTVVGYR